MSQDPINEWLQSLPPLDVHHASIMLAKKIDEALVEVLGDSVLNRLESREFRYRMMEQVEKAVVDTLKVYDAARTEALESLQRAHMALLNVTPGPLRVKRIVAQPPVLEPDEGKEG